MDATTCDEIDAFARTIEQQIARQQGFIDGLPEFDSRYRKTVEAETHGLEAMFR